ncbi:SCO-spondin-like [Saccoglossus kowalevskii]
MVATTAMMEVTKQSVCTRVRKTNLHVHPGIVWHRTFGVMDYQTVMITRMSMAVVLQSVEKVNFSVLNLRNALQEYFYVTMTTTVALMTTLMKKTASSVMSENFPAIPVLVFPPYISVTVMMTVEMEVMNMDVIAPALTSSLVEIALIVYQHMKFVMASSSVQMDQTKKCVVTTTRPSVPLKIVEVGMTTLPSVTCGPNQYICTSGECINTIEVCDNKTDCQSGEDEARDSCVPLPAIDGGWSTWSEWTECPTTCDVSSKRRFRTCIDPEPSNGGRVCEGREEETEECAEEPCPVDGNWTPWSPWRPCTNTCDGGSKLRFRSCSNGRPQFGGAPCPGAPFQTAGCNMQPCGEECVDGKVELTADQCHGTCPRSCNALSNSVECLDTCEPGCHCPENQLLDKNGVCVETENCGCFYDGEMYAIGEIVKKKDCNNCTCESGGVLHCTEHECDVDCMWSEWTPWGECPVTCSGSDYVGQQKRYRYPDPQATGNGERCTSSKEVDVNDCNTEPCPIPGQWTPWSPWRQCTKSCETGLKMRFRSCTANRPANGGVACPGKPIDMFGCNVLPCDTECQEPKEFKECSCPQTCEHLSGAAYCEENCETGCYCPEGMVLHNDTCMPVSECPCLDADGNVYENGQAVPDECNTCTCHEGNLIDCTEDVCDVDGDWSSWSAWSDCDKPCEGGVSRRYRGCVNPAPKGLGRDCEGTDVENKPCNTEPCEEDGAWGSWSPWSECTVTCGAGVTTRTRDCDDPAPAGGGRPCPGNETDISSCLPSECPVTTCVNGTAWDECGPDCPRTCADLENCIPQCAQGCYCTEDDEVLNPEGDCVKPSECPCRNPDTGEIIPLGATVEQDCNICECVEGRMMCTEEDCPVDGEWTSWSPWSECDVKCEGRPTIQFRTRTCTSPEPSNGGRECEGAPDQTANCPEMPCPRTGSWGPWDNWSGCERCEIGEQTRKRFCTRPYPIAGGTEESGCPGNTTQTKACPLDEDCKCLDEQTWSECASICPRTCEDLQEGVACLNDECTPGCECPLGTVLQDEMCVPPEECRCKYPMSEVVKLLDDGLTNQATSGPAEEAVAEVLSQIGTTLSLPEGGVENLKPGPEKDALAEELVKLLETKELNPGEIVTVKCNNCTCEAGHLICAKKNVKLMEIGHHGHHGLNVVSHVAALFKQEDDCAQTHHLLVVESHVLAALKTQHHVMRNHVQVNYHLLYQKCV